jgi:hypothetical protein
MILQVTIMITGVVRWEIHRKIPIGLQKDCRWRNVIAILLIAFLKRLAAEIAEPQLLGGPYSLLRLQFDWHNGAPLWVDGLRAGVGLPTGPRGH